MLRSRHADGVILTLSLLGDELIDALVAEQRNFVLIGRPADAAGRLSHPTVPFVNNDNVLAAVMAVEHLVSRGHRRIGFINGPRHWVFCHDRLQGYRQGLQEAGIPFAPELVQEIPITNADGARACERLLTLPDPPTAVLAVDEKGRHMSSKPFLIDAVLGNSRMLITLTRDAQVQRLFWPHVDGAQHVERILGGVSVDGGPVIWQDSAAWQHTQAYEDDQNVLVTGSRLAPGLEVTATDAAWPGRDVFVRRLALTNHGARTLAVQYALFQWIRIDENPLYNTALFDAGADALVHCRRDCFLATGADREMADVAVGAPDELYRSATALALGSASILHGDVAGAARCASLRPKPGRARRTCLAFRRRLPHPSDWRPFTGVRCWCSS